jgi:hypothetical protein
LKKNALESFHREQFSVADTEQLQIFAVLAACGSKKSIDFSLFFILPVFKYFS